MDFRNNIFSLQISKVEVFPRKTADISKNNLICQLRKRPYWCISRQRAWGTPIPVFYSRSTGQPIVHKQIIDHLCSLMTNENSNIDFWWTKSVAELIPGTVLQELGLNADEIEKGQDILDIWFDSGISWSYALDNEQVSHVNLEGIDQFTGWFQSSLMTSVAARGIAPYRSLFVHGFAVDEKGHKMSKSLGNVIVPRDIISKYGVDTLRWWVAHHAAQHTSIPVGQSTLQGSAENMQKIRATLKYLVGCLPVSTNTLLDLDVRKLKILDRYFLNLLVEFERDVLELCREHSYNRVTALVLNFVTNSLSAFYLHLIKDRLYCGTIAEYQDLQSVLQRAFLILNKVLWPLTPFVVEECWSFYNEKPFYMQNLDFKMNQFTNQEFDGIIEQCIQLKQYLNQSVPDINTWTLNVTISCTEESIVLLQVNIFMIQNETKVW